MIKCNKCGCPLLIEGNPIQSMYCIVCKDGRGYFDNTKMSMTIHDVSLDGNDFPVKGFCPLCGSTGLYKHIRGDYKGMFEMTVCNACSHEFVIDIKQ